MLDFVWTFALFWLFRLSYLEAQECFQWYEGHQDCRFCATEPIAATSHSAQGNTECIFPSYVTYFKQLLSQPTSEYHKEVAESVLNLYKDLSELQKPAVLINEAVPPGNSCSPVKSFLSFVDDNFFLAIRLQILFI